MIDLRSIFEISGFSFVVSLVLTPFVRDRFAGLGLVDLPDGGRKFHARAVPRVGGIPIVLSYVTAFLFLLAMPGSSGAAFERHLPFVIRLLPSACIIFLTGLLDDIVGLRPWQKLAGQALGAVAAVAAGVRIAGVSGLPLGETLGAAFTVGWLIFCTNAFNLVDGLDGLASGMGLFSTLTMFVAALLTSDQALALATLPLCGSLLGFLRYNFNPASVFLGDSGSLLIGFLLGCYGVIWTQKSATLLGMTAPAMALAIPLLDAGLSIARRWLGGKPIFSGDRSHIHHKLLDKGLTHRGVVVVLYGVCSVGAALSLLQTAAANRAGGLILILFCAAAWAGIHSLGYLEFSAAGRAVFGGAVRRALHGQVALHALERNLERTASAQACWETLRVALADAGFHAIHARFNGEEFRWNGRAHRSGWQLRVPLDGGDYVNLEKSFDGALPGVIIGPLVEMLHRRLPVSLAAARAEPDARAATEVLSLARLARGVAAADAQEPMTAVLGRGDLVNQGANHGKD